MDTIGWSEGVHNTQVPLDMRLCIMCIIYVAANVSTVRTPVCIYS